MPFTNGFNGCVAYAITETNAMTSLYESDFFAWANEQASLLRAGKLSSADIENIAEEVITIFPVQKSLKDALAALRAMAKPPDVEIYEPIELPERN